MLQSLLKSLQGPLNKLLEKNNSPNLRKVCSMPAIVMNNGREMPLLGLGTWDASCEFIMYEKTYEPYIEDNEDKKIMRNKTAKGISRALDMGYRHIDCAHVHGNEKIIGKVIAQKLKCNVVKREDLFITSKLWNTFHEPESVLCSCTESLNDLRLEYLDMYIMQTPMAYKEECGHFPITDGCIDFNDVDYLCTWKAMEKLVDMGLCHNIGVSNFNKSQLERLISRANIIPQTLQIELHPYLGQSDLVEFAKGNDVCVTAYAPLGSRNRPWASDERVLLEDPKVTLLAHKHSRTPAQILLRYQVQLCNAVIPKSYDYDHLVENFNIFNFELSPNDMQNLESLDHNLRYFQLNGSRGHPYYPFKD